MIKLEVNHKQHEKKIQSKQINKQQKDPNKSTTVDVKNGAQLTNKNNQQKIDQQNKKVNKLDNQSPNISKKQINNNIITNNLKTIDKKLQKSDTYLQTITQINQTKQKLKFTIEDLIQQYKESAQMLFEKNGHNPEKQKQIKQHLKALKEQKRNRRKKIKLLNQIKSKTVEHKQQKERQVYTERISKHKLNAKKKAQYTIKSIDLKAQQRLQQKAKFAQFYQNYKKSKPKYKIIQQQYQRKLEEQKQRQQLIKKRIKEHFAPINKQDLDSFEQKYIQEQYQLNMEIYRKRQLQKQLQEENKKQLMKIWRSENYKKLQQQKANQLKAQAEQATKKLQRTKQYSLFVRSQHRPTNIKSNESLSVSQQPQQQTHPNKIIKKKYRYLNGANQGSIIQYHKKPLSHEEVVQKGRQYLQYVSKIPKVHKKHDQKKQQENIITIKPRKQRVPVFNIFGRQNPFYKKKEKIVDLSQITDRHLKNMELQKIRAKDEFLQIKNKIIIYGNSKNYTQVMKRKNQLTAELVNNISDKLNILSKL